MSIDHDESKRQGYVYSYIPRMLIITFWVWCLCMSVFGILILIGILGLHTRVERTEKFSPAYGYDEKQNVWNRIRVDENGKVVCQQ